MTHSQRHFDKLVVTARDAVQRFGLGDIEAEVVFVIDVSRAMVPLYRAKTADTIAAQLLALSLSFDDDGVIPAYAFGGSCRRLADLRAADLEGYIRREVIRSKRDIQSACRFAPAIQQICHDRFGGLDGKPDKPVFVLFVTSGDCEDELDTAEAIRASSKLPIFWQFIGLSDADGPPASFPFLRRLDQLRGTYVDNCGFFQPPSVSDTQELFAGLLNEFPAYVTKGKVRAMLKPKATRGPATGELDIAALRAKLAAVEWVESTLPGGAQRAAQPVIQEVDDTPKVSRRRRARPDQDDPPPSKAKRRPSDRKRALQARMAKLRDRLGELEDEQALEIDEDDVTLQGDAEAAADLRQRLRALEDEDSTIQGG